MNKKTLYFEIILIVIITIFIFFANNLFLSPKYSGENQIKDQNLEKIDHNILLDKKLIESDTSLLRNTLSEHRLPKSSFIKIEDYKINIEHNDIFEDGKLKSSYNYYAVDEKGDKSEIILPDKRIIDFTEKGILSEGKIYVKGKIDEREIVKNSNERSITGYQIYNPSVAFNRRKISVAVVIPYNNVTINLSSNYQQFLGTILQNVKSYYLDNSDAITNFNFSLYPLFNSSFTQNTAYHELFNWLDPYINFSQTEFIVIIDYNPAYAGSGVAAYYYGNNALSYITTNEGPIIDGFTKILVDYNTSSYIYTSGYYAKTFAHEIGHYIALFNPQLSVDFGTTPHAHGVNPPYDCSLLGSAIICNVTEYGDNFDIMGNGRGSFHEHSSAYYMGLSDASNVQSITTSGTYQLCNLNYPLNPNCHRELLIQNPNGNNLALELRTETGHGYYGCPAIYFDRVLIRATDLEEGGGLNKTSFNLQYGIKGGSVLIPYDYSIQSCTNYSLFKYGLPVGNTTNLGLGEISVLNITNTSNGGKMATIFINYSVPPCYSNAPILKILQSPVYYSNLFSTNSLDYGPKIKIKNNDICNTIERFNLSMTVSVAGNALVNSSLFRIVSQQELDLFEFPLPQSLNGFVGSFNYTITVSKISNTSQNASLSGSLSLINYNPQILGPYLLTGCSDNDPIPFNLQTLGANFTAYPPNNGAVINITGYPSNSYVSDFCQDTVTATDVVCGINTGYPQLQNQGFIIVKDCRFVLNKPSATCYSGVCY